MLMRNTLLSLSLLPFLAVPSFFSFAAPAPAVKDPTAVTAGVVEPVPGAMLDLNKADAATLQSQLSGIGKTKAEAIVAYREEHGDFASVDELLEIKGIGKALLDRNREKLKVN